MDKSKEGRNITRKESRGNNEILGMKIQLIRAY
jgi:hypothetical protein